MDAAMNYSFSGTQRFDKYFTVGLLLLFSLSARTVHAQLIRVGSGTVTNTATTYPTPFGANYAGQRAQYLYKAAQLSGLNPGTIGAIAFYVTSLNGSAAHDTFTISLANTNISSLSSFITGPGTMNVYYTSTCQPVLGWNVFPLQIPFVYIGTDLMLEVAHSNRGSAHTANASVYLCPGSGINCYSNTGSYGSCSTTPNTYTLIPQIMIGRITACNGVPFAGTTVPSGSTNACMGRTDTITAINYTIAANTVFQWMQSTDGGSTWVPAVGGMGAGSIRYMTPPLLRSVRYHMVITCSTSGLRDSTADVIYNIPLPNYAPLPFYEDFEQWVNSCDSEDVPTNHWINLPYHGNRSWRRDDSGPNAGWLDPDSGAYAPAANAGLHSARFHAYAAPPGDTSAGILAAFIDCSVPAGKKTLRFYLHSDARAIPNDSLRVRLSEDGGASFSPLAMYGPGTGGWDMKSLTIASDSPRTVLLFQALSQSGGYQDIGLDSLSLVPAAQTGINTTTTKGAGLQLYPNPAASMIAVRATAAGTLSLHDLTGRRLARFSIRSNAEEKIPLQGLPPGVYLYQFVAPGRENVFGKLFVLQ